MNPELLDAVRGEKGDKNYCPGPQSIPCSAEQLIEQIQQDLETLKAMLKL